MGISLGHESSLIIHSSVPGKASCLLSLLILVQFLQECVSLAGRRVQELRSILDEALQSTEMDED